MKAQVAKASLGFVEHVGLADAVRLDGLHVRSDAVGRHCAAEQTSESGRAGHSDLQRAEASKAAQRGDDRRVAPKDIQPTARVPQGLAELVTGFDRVSRRVRLGGPRMVVEDDLVDRDERDDVRAE